MATENIAEPDGQFGLRRWKGAMNQGMATNTLLTAQGRRRVRREKNSRDPLPLSAKVIASSLHNRLSGKAVHTGVYLIQEMLIHIKR